MLMMGPLVDVDRWAVRNGYPKIAVGDVFTKEVKYKPWVADQPREVEYEREINVVVLDIHFYKGFQPSMIEGQTAIVTLHGVGLEGLTRDSVLLR